MMTGWTMGIDGWIWMGVWVVALVIAVALLVWTPRRHAREKEPLDVLRSRLARGEISPEEYERAVGLLDPAKRGRATSSSIDRETNR